MTGWAMVRQGVGVGVGCENLWSGTDVDRSRRFLDFSAK